MASEDRIPVAMTIATSDSGGGAGIQADLKAFARCGVHGTSAIVALTAQNTHEVISVETIPRQMILDQVRAVAEDIGVDAVKIGMLFDRPTIEAVVEALALIRESGGSSPRETGGSSRSPLASAEPPHITPVVVDPVMVAESGAVLLEPAAKSALIEQVLPLAAVVTPNLGEAREISGLGERASTEELARAIHSLGPGAVVVTGGHTDEGADLFFDGETVEEIEGPRHPAGASHGSGCTHSSALAAHLALHLDPLEAAVAAREIAGEAVRSGLRELGAGSGPVDALNVRQRAELGERQ